MGIHKKYRVILLACMLVFSLVYIGLQDHTSALDIQYSETTKNDGNKKTYILSSSREFTVYILTRSQAGHETVGGSVQKDNWDNYFRSGSFVLTPTNIQDGYRFVEWRVDWGKYSVNPDTKVLTINENGKNSGSATAVYEFIGFETNYNLGNGGTFNVNGTSTYIERLPYGQATAPEVALNPGYQNLRWSTNLNITGSSTINAIYDVDVTFDAKNGEAVSTQQISQGSEVSSGNIPTHSGYNFMGWYSDEAFTKKVTFPVVVNEPTTFYANWEAAYYKIDYDANGGSISGSTQQTIQYKTPLTNLKNASRTGYMFKGWNTVADGSGDTYTSLSEMPARDLRLYAQWEQEHYAVNFYSDAGGALLGNQSIAYGDKVQVIDQPTRTGFEFLGWKIAGSDVYWDFENQVVIHPLDLIGQWREIMYYDVSFITHTSDVIENYTDVLENTTIEEPSLLTRNGYQFEGWYTSTTYMKKWNFDVDVLTVDLTLYAKWVGHEHTVSFDVNGAWTRSPLVQHVRFDGLITEPSRNPKRIGYNFVSWIYNTSIWDFLNSKMVDSDVTLTASYEAKMYAISFVANASNVQNLPDTRSAIAYKSIVTSPETVPTRDGYQFVSWNTQSNGAGQSWDDVFANGMVLNNVRMYAQWEKTK